MNFDAPTVSICFGVFLLAVYTWMWISPVKSIEILKSFARSVWPARILVAITVAWFAYNLNQVDFGRFNTLKTGLWVLVPAGIYAIVTYIPDLLAVRGFCTFCLLAGQPVLVASRWHGSISQYAVALLVYLLMVECMFLVVYPHFWIRGLNWMSQTAGRRKGCLTAGSLLGAVMLGCGVFSL